MKAKNNLKRFNAAFFALTFAALSVGSVGYTVNAEENEYSYTETDAENLKDFLLKKETDNISEKLYDLNNDGKWSVVDLCLMLRDITGTQNSENKMQIDVNGTTLTATLADTTAANELKELLKKGAISVNLGEYGGFEKVGKLPQSFTRDDVQTKTEAGDIMLYQGNQMTIFYNSNSWSYTKLGHIDNVTQDELKSIFGDGDITVTLSIK